MGYMASRVGDDNELGRVCKVVIIAYVKAVTAHAYGT